MSWTQGVAARARRGRLAGSLPERDSATGGAVAFVRVGALVAAALLVPLGVAALGRVAGQPLGAMSRDPTAVAGLHPWVGLLSNLSLFAWSAAAAVALFCVGILRDDGLPSTIHARWFAGAGALSLLLLFDDAFLLHEEFFVYVVGIPEKATLGLYALCALAWLVTERRSLPRTPWLLLVMAGLGFAASVGADVMAGDRVDDVETYLEDALKWVGIVGWLGYIAETGLRSVRAARR